MRGATSSLFTGLNDSSQSVTLKIWWKTGNIFEEIFSIDRSTFADVKFAAVRYFEENHFNPCLTEYSCSSSISSNNNRTIQQRNLDMNNYKLISIESKRVVDENKTLSEGRVKDQDEYFLAERKISKIQRSAQCCSIDEKLIESRTENLVRPRTLFPGDHRRASRTEFRTDLNCILITLIETAQKLLWFHPDAENIFQQAEEILTKPFLEESNSTCSNLEDRNVQRDLICKLMEMGFTEEQSKLALNRTKNDLHAAMELLLIQPDFIDDQRESQENSQMKNVEICSNEKKLPFFTRDGPFIPFRQYRQQRFQANSRAIQSLKDMGFNEENIVEALRRFNNDQNLACEFLLGDRQQQQMIIEANNDQSLDPNSTMFQSIIQNPIVQRTLNNPKTFFVMLKIAENPSMIGNYLNDPDIGNMLLQISRIYHAERDQLHSTTTNRTTTNDFVNERITSNSTDHFHSEFDNDSD